MSELSESASLVGLRLGFFVAVEVRFCLDEDAAGVIDEESLDGAFESPEDSLRRSSSLN